jgi:dTDP-4-dehydrorhamnose 3,5-epimerase
VRFVETAIPDVWIVEIEPHQDDRGFFARTWCEREAASRGIAFGTVQCNISFNRRRGTLRGMHYQAAPSAEQKLVRCTRGSLVDVAVDIRRSSPTFGRYVSVELSAENRRTLYIPKGCAHGFLTLEDETEVFYQMSAYHTPDAGRGFRWNDPEFRIQWPIEIAVIAERDRGYPDFGPGDRQ